MNHWSISIISGIIVQSEKCWENHISLKEGFLNLSWFLRFVWQLQCSVLIPNGKIDITPSADDEQYIIQGHSIQSTNSIANAGPSLDHLGSYDTTDWQEVVRLMGGTPQIPQWLPEGWSVTRYSIDLMDSFSALEIKYENNERSEEWLSYTLFVYFSIDDMYNAVEKDRNGTEILLNNGKKVYMFGNLGTQDIMWIEGQNEFNLSGNIENRYMLQMAESIK